MELDRDAQARDIASRLGRNRLIWAGTRGTDAEPLLEFGALGGVVSLIAPMQGLAAEGLDQTCLESLSRRRVDLDLYDVDLDTSDFARELHRALFAQLQEPCWLVPYRPTAFLNSAYYPRKARCTHLGMFAGHAGAYDHKPWVESELRARGIPTIPWAYYHDDDIRLLASAMGVRDYVLRANYSDGGAGLVRVPAGADPEAFIPPHTGGFLAAAPLLQPSIPLNISGCVFPGGQVTVRTPSVQLIGIPSCTRREFGYCGNDFVAPWHLLDGQALDELESIGRQTGRWLSRTGYLGAFGLDALLFEGEVMVTEVNPRFQGCSAAGAVLARQLGMGDVYLDHLSAFLGVSPALALPLREQARLQAQQGYAVSQIVCHNCTGRPALRTTGPISTGGANVVSGLPASGIEVEDEAMLFKLLARRSVTHDGAQVDQETRRVLLSIAAEGFVRGSADRTSFA